MFPVRAVAKVAVHRQHRFSNGLDVFRRKKSNHIRHARVRLRVIVRHAHAAARSEIVSRQFAVLLDSHEAQTIGQHIRVVVRRCGEADFEFSR